MPSVKESKSKKTSTRRSSAVLARARAEMDKAGDAAVARARAGDAMGPGDHGKLTKYQLALRDSAILARAHAGSLHREIAAEFGITARAVDQVVARLREARSGLDDRPMEILEWIARSYLRSMGDFQAMAAHQAKSNPAVALGAMKAAGDALERYTVLMVEVGSLPANLNLFRAESVLRRMADELVEVMERVESGEMSPMDAGVFFRELVGPDQATLSEGA
jgi:hypothetical protein